FFHNCGEHSLRRTAGRKIIFIFRILVAEEFYPCRTAGGKERKFVALSQTFQEFFGFFHDGQVSGKGCIIYLVKSHTMEYSYQIAHNTVTLVQSESVPYGYPDSRSYLCNYPGIGVGNGLPYFIHVGLYADSACRTVDPALAAAYTVRFSQTLIKGRHNHGISASESKA